MDGFFNNIKNYINKFDFTGGERSSWGKEQAYIMTGEEKLKPSEEEYKLS